MKVKFKNIKFILVIGCFLFFLMCFFVQAIHTGIKAQASDSPHLCMASVNGFIARTWSADPADKFSDLYLKESKENAINCPGGSVANFQYYTTKTDIMSYSNLDTTLGAEQANLYAGQPVTIYVEYYNKNSKLLQTSQNKSKFNFLNVDTAYADTDKSTTLFAADENEFETEIIQGNFDNAGSFSFVLKRAGIFTVVANTKTNPDSNAGTNGNQDLIDRGSISPKTGLF